MFDVEHHNGQSKWTNRDHAELHLAASAVRQGGYCDRGQHAQLASAHALLAMSESIDRLVDGMASLARIADALDAAADELTSPELDGAKR